MHFVGHINTVFTHIDIEGGGRPSPNSCRILKV